MGNKASKGGSKKSLMAQAYTKDVEQALKGKKAKCGWTIDDVIRSGVVNKDSGVGCYAGDHDCYLTFAPFFDKVIKMYHNYDRPTGKYNADFNPKSLKFGNPDPEGKYVISTRVRVGRNVKDTNFSTSISLEDRLELEKKIVDALKGLKKDLKGDYYPLEGMDETVRQRLVDDHFLFKAGDRFLDAAGANRDWPKGRGIFHSADKRFLVWLNEEDQIRIISMQQGADIKEVFERLSRAVGTLEKKLEFAFDPSLGWLSSCPTNLGTAMRASVHIKIPKFSANKAAFEKLCAELRVQPRGIHGEHTETDGGVYDISNKERLGVSEVECAQILYDAVVRLIAEEQKLEGVSGGTLPSSASPSSGGGSAGGGSKGSKRGSKRGSSRGGSSRGSTKGEGSTKGDGASSGSSRRK